MINGSCLCGAIKFTVAGNFDSVSHCHCKMCQKQHGAAYATYARFNREDLHYIRGESQLTIYNSSDDILRKFCKTCGSNIEWTRSIANPKKVGLAVGLFDSEFTCKAIKDLHLESKEKWLLS